MKKTTLSTAILIALSSSQLQAAEDTNTTLEPVFASANYVSMPLYSVTASTSIITAKEIKENHYRTLGDAIKSIPGIQIIRSGGLGTTTSIFMRGQSNKSTLVLVNGVEMNNPMGTGGAIISSLLLADVERIEIIKGAQSGIWGANASAGVINIITKKATHGTNGTVNIEAGSNRQTRLAGTLSSANEQGDFALGFSTLSTDGFSAVKVYGQSVDNYEDDAFRQTDFSLDMGININKAHRVEVLVKTANSTSNYDYTNNPNAIASNNYKNDLKRIQYLYSKNNLDTRLYLSENKISQYNDAIIDSVGLKGAYAYQKDQSLAFVIENNKYINEANSDNYDNTGVGLTNTNQFNNQNLIMTESLRSDQYSTFEDKVTGKIGAKNYFTDNLALSANFGTAYNAPTLFQSTANYGSSPLTPVDPEQTQSFDINLSLYDLELSYYNTETKNLIDYSFTTNQYDNLKGTSKFEGIELSYQKNVKAIQTLVQLTYAQGTAKDDNGEWLARRAENTAGLNLTYQGFNKTSLILDTRYQGKTYDKANQQGAQIGEYFVTDFSVNYDATANLSLYANVLNVFAEDYTQAVASYVGTSTTPKKVYSNGGRQLFVGLQGKL